MYNSRGYFTIKLQLKILVIVGRKQEINLEPGEVLSCFLIEVEFSKDVIGFYWGTRTVNADA